MTLSDQQTSISRTDQNGTHQPGTDQTGTHQTGTDPADHHQTSTDQADTDHGGTDQADHSQTWWKTAVVYQIYPRSFADSNGDGIGDIRGIIAKLDYLSELGVDVVWLSPFYKSPMDDNGYDISDYQDVDPIFGTLADLDELIGQLHQRNMKLMIDVVINHTSDDHPWFVESRSSKANPKRDWYWWAPARDGLQAGEPGAEPTNWRSFFSGPTWELDVLCFYCSLTVLSRDFADTEVVAGSSPRAWRGRVFRWKRSCLRCSPAGCR